MPCHEVDMRQHGRNNKVSTAHKICSGLGAISLSLGPNGPALCGFMVVVAF